MWAAHGKTLKFRRGVLAPEAPIAAFDFDGTLAPYRGKGPSVDLTRRVLAGLLRRGFNVVIISNRSGDSAKTLAPLEEYIAELDRATNGPAVTVYAATGHDQYRKPRTGIWKHYTAQWHNVPAQLDVSPPFAFYCGDAAGRVGDFSADDYAFALNIGVPFVLADMMFGGRIDRGEFGHPGDGRELFAPPETLGARAMDIKEIIAELRSVRQDDSGVTSMAVRARAERTLRGVIPKDGPRLIILVGSPASGKSTFAVDFYFAVGIRYVSRDRSGAMWLKEVLDILTLPHDWRRWTGLPGGVQVAANACVVDNTSPRKADREAIVKIGRAAGAHITICHIATPKHICFHLNGARYQKIGVGVPDIALHTYWKRFEKPTADEADALVTLPFALDEKTGPEITSFRYSLPKW